MNRGVFCAQNIAAAVFGTRDEVLLLRAYAFAVGLAQNTDVFASICHNVGAQK